MDYKLMWDELKEWILQGDIDCAKMAKATEISGNKSEFIRLKSKSDTLSMVAGKMYEMENIKYILDSLYSIGNER